jgi:hypothetical protein
MDHAILHGRPFGIPLLQGPSMRPVWNADFTACGEDGDEFKRPEGVKWELGFALFCRTEEMGLLRI